MDLHFQGLAWFNKGFTPNRGVQHRRAAFRSRVVRQSRSNVAALIGSAGAEAIEGANSFVTDPHRGLRGRRSKVASAIASSRTIIRSTFTTLFRAAPSTLGLTRMTRPPSAWD